MLSESKFYHNGTSCKRLEECQLYDSRTHGHIAEQSHLQPLSCTCWQWREIKQKHDLHPQWNHKMTSANEVKEAIFLRRNSGWEANHVVLLCYRPQIVSITLLAMQLHVKVADSICRGHQELPVIKWWEGWPDAAWVGPDAASAGYQIWRHGFHNLGGFRAGCVHNKPIKCSCTVISTISLLKVDDWLMGGWHDIIDIGWSKLM